MGDVTLSKSIEDYFRVMNLTILVKGIEINKIIDVMQFYRKIFSSSIYDCLEFS